MILEHDVFASHWGGTPSETGIGARVFPNPSSRGLQVAFSQAVGPGLRASVYNITGRLVDRLRVPEGAAGIAWRHDGLAAGTYFVRIESVAGDVLSTARATIVR